jgi:hypothetical protein
MVEAIPLPVKMALPKIHRSLHSSRGVEAVEAFLPYYKEPFIIFIMHN